MKLRKAVSLAVAIVLSLCALTAAPAEPADTACTAKVAPLAYEITPAVTLAPLTADAPAEAADPEATADATPEALPTDMPAAPANGSVSIALIAPETLRMGDTVTLVATLAGYDGLSVQLQWQSTRDGTNWADVEGANGLSYAFTVDEHTAGSSWRLAVTVS